MIDRTTIDRIYERADIVDVIGEFITLKKRGANYLGHCPFHDERTPSFTVSPAKSIFKCFGCGKSGNAVGFVMEHESISYVEALRFLAKKYHIEIEETAPNPEQIQQQNRREALQVITNWASGWFKEQLHKTSEGKNVGLSYFRERGFTDSIIERFSLGYSPSNRSAFSKAAIAKGYKTDIVVESGLSVDRNGSLFDRFADRVLFPIQSITGQVIGFGGRTMQKEKNIAKYLNSPETLLYNKSRVLYGMYQARKSISTSDKCFLVEGYTDVLSMYQAGIENVVASSGTSLTVDQIRLIKRFTPNLTVFYDGDAAGIKASLRGIDMILSEEMNVKVCLLPEGEDPDSFARKHSTEKLTQFIKENETDFVRFKTTLMLGEAKGDPIKKAALVNDILATIACIPNMVSRSIYLKECSQMLEMPEDILYKATSKIINDKLEKEQKQQFYSKQRSESIPDNTTVPIEESVVTLNNDILITETELIKLLIEYGDHTVFMVPGADKGCEDAFLTVSEFIIEELERDELFPMDASLHKIFQIYCDSNQKGIQLSSFYFTQNPDLAISSKVAEMLAPEHTLSRLWEQNNPNEDSEEVRLSQAVQKVVNEYKWRRLKEMQNILTKKLSDSQMTDDEISTLMVKLDRINKIKTQLSSELGSRSIL
ncbi:MAG: DNA primase [Salinivirgaceae bacterium]|nr:DNA primase [Salinivirgaceae bacterium]MDD4747958.1 DNA primase [Salinivirgaceae bacterium]MDY0279634.1 DNA primase [Salinivirgaceae bacterium]